MRVPGSDLLSEAFALIDTCEVIYRKYKDRELNALGLWVTSYEEDVYAEASVQATDRTTYQQFGLDMQKNYMTLYLSLDAIDLSRNVSGDQFILPDGFLYQLESSVPWYDYDGWVTLTVVEVSQNPTSTLPIPERGIDL